MNWKKKWMCVKYISTDMRPEGHTFIDKKLSVIDLQHWYKLAEYLMYNFYMLLKK